MPWHDELDVLIRAVRAAGKEALRMAVDGFETVQKADHSPVTSADLAVNRILQSRLQSAFPGTDGSQKSRRTIQTGSRRLESGW